MEPPSNPGSRWLAPEGVPLLCQLARTFLPLGKVTCHGIIVEPAALGKLEAASFMPCAGIGTELGSHRGEIGSSELDLKLLGFDCLGSELL